MDARIAAASLVAVLLAWPVLADAPPAPASTTVCSLEGEACAARPKDGRTATIWRNGPHEAKASVWRTSITSPRLTVSDDGNALVELYAGLNLLAADAAPDTVVLVFHRRGSNAVAVRLRDVIADTSKLPRASSHRRWARAYGLDGKGSFVLLTAEGRNLLRFRNRPVALDA